MKILQIASVYPVKDSSWENPYVYNFIRHYARIYKADIGVLKPVSFRPNWLIILSKRKKYWHKKMTICNTGIYLDDNISVNILPYFSIGSLSALHSLFSIIAGGLSKKRIKQLSLKDVQIIHAHFLFPDGIMACQLSKKYHIPYVLTMRQELRFLKNPISRFFVKKIIQNASIVTTHSPQMIKGLEDIGIKKVKLLPTGIEDYFFKNSSQSERSEAGPPDGQESPHKPAENAPLSHAVINEEKTVGNNDKKIELKLVSVCNLLPVKNLESVIQAISTMPEKIKISYSIFGTGPLENSLKRMVLHLQLENQIQFEGAIENNKLPRILPDFDVYIQPSFKETFGLSYFEALACGLPIILTKNTGAYEMIKDKDIYYLVDPNKTESITSCISNILKNKETLVRKTMHTKEAAKLASWNRFIDYFHERYEEVIKRN